MKRLLIYMIAATLLFSACSTPSMPATDPTAAPSISIPTESPTQVPTTPSPEVPATEPTNAPTEAPTLAPAEGKILLKIEQFPTDPDPAEVERTYAETHERTVYLENLELPETALKVYEQDAFLAPIADLLKAELELTLDAHWTFYIHYYTQEQDVGLAVFTYWIEGTIATNRAVTVLIESNTARTLIYSYLDRSADEAALLQKLQHFLDTHEQERVNLLGDDFDIALETTNYIYNFRTDELTYSYNIFYRHIATGITDNSFGTELIIE